MQHDLSAFRRTFFEESGDGLALMESGLLALQDGTADPEVINSVFRAAHSIKGGAGTFGFAAVAHFTHGLETVLDELRAGRRTVAPDLVDLLLQAVDVLGSLLRGAESGDPVDADAVERVRAALAGLSPAMPDAPAVAAETANAPAAALSVGRFDVRFAPHRNLFASGNDPARLLKELRALGDYSVELDVGELPPFAEMDPECCYVRWQAQVCGADVSHTSVAEIFDWVADECDLTITAVEPVDAVVASEAAREREAGAVLATGAEAAGASVRPGPGADSGSIRVKTNRIDTLINLVGELVITQSMLGELGQNFDPSRLAALRAGLTQLERNTRELQEHVIGIRMVPVALAFNRFPRLVREVGRQLGKSVQLRLSGEQTELDKTVVEQIGDPLTHLVRNALDHGIELPDRRLASGKPADGLITLNAYHRGGEVVIEVHDDGGGLNVERIREKAVARGLIAADATPSDERLHELIFEPGFSTAERVSDLSGRGVGMDVVRRNIKQLGGSVDVRSAAGAGTTFTIRLPLTLAILDGQLLKIGGQTFVAPLVSIVETVRIDPALVGRVAGRDALYRLRDEYLPIVRPHALFHLAGATAPLEQSLLMVVESEGRRAGLLVDELTAQQQVVIKSLEMNFRPVPGLSGATILGDGTVALILDVAGLIALGLESGRTPASPTPHRGEGGPAAPTRQGEPLITAA